jgi:O-6-methylguanine DNA methyltransferase
MTDRLTSDLAALAMPAPDRLPAAVLDGLGLADRYVTRESAVGPLFVAFNDHGVSFVDLADDAAEFERRFRELRGRRVRPADDIPERLVRLLDTAIAEGRPGRLPVDLRGLTEFQVAVLRKAAAIPRGQVRPYGWVAKEIGKPGAVRAVGSALAHNPIPLIIPCHRVVRSDGSLGEYSMGATENKRALLEAEGMDVDEFEDLAGRGVRFVGSDTTHVFCNPTCTHGGRITERHRREFASERQARSAGYRPCKVCRPVAA